MSPSSVVEVDWQEGEVLGGRSMGRILFPKPCAMKGRGGWGKIRIRLNGVERIS